MSKCYGQLRFCSSAKVPLRRVPQQDKVSDVNVLSTLKKRLGAKSNVYGFILEPTPSRVDCVSVMTLAYDSIPDSVAASLHPTRHDFPGLVPAISHSMFISL